MPEFIEVAKEDEIKEGQGKTVEAKGIEIGLFKKDSKFYAINNICLHQGGPLGEGYLSGCMVECSLHGWTYDIRTGESPMGVKVETYSVKVENGKVFVQV